MGLVTTGLGKSTGVHAEQASNTARGAPGDRRSLRKFLGIASSPRGAEAVGSVMTPASRAALALLFGGRTGVA